MSAVGCSALSEALLKKDSLECLCICSKSYYIFSHFELILLFHKIAGNHLGYQGAEQIAKIIGSKCLKCLETANNSIDDAGGQVIAKSLIRNETLEELDLCSSFLSFFLKFKLNHDSFVFFTKPTIMIWKLRNILHRFSNTITP